MNFIECIFESFQKGIACVSGDIPHEIQSFCIGSGLFFNVYLNISSRRADKIYKCMVERLEDVLDEYLDTLKKQQKFKQDFLNLLEKKNEKK